MTLFSDLKLDPKVLKAIQEAGYSQPTPIQAGAIPPALEGRDVLGIAQTGTGKTASFTLPMITLLGRGRARARMPRSLVLCPTRELAAQVAENFDIYAKHTKLTKALLIGGVSFTEQDKLIDRGVDVLIATPGRLLDHFERGKLLLTGVQIMVVDEADRMLDMGFIPDIERIFQLTPFTRQTLFFSATMAPEIERITNTFLHSPERIEVARQATTSETITQRLIEITPTRRDQSAKQKRELLRAVIRAEEAREDAPLKNAIIFCNRKTDVDIVAKSLKKHGFDAAPIHGDLDQSQRMRTLDGFRDGSLKLLVASDVAARGLDIPAVSHVFNFDLPSHAEDYVHRIGRTGRAGRLGTAISIGTPADEKYLTAIEGLIKQSLPRVAAPEGFSLSESAQTAPRPRDDRKGGQNGRDRDRRRHDHRPFGDDARAAAPVAAIEPVREERHETARREDRREDRSDDRRDRRDRRDHRDGRRDPVIVGLGDHVPEFLTNVFRPGYIEKPGAEVEAPVPASTPPAAGTPEVKTEDRKPRPRRRSSGRASEVNEPAPEPVAENLPEPQPVPETAAPAPQPEPEAQAEPAPEARAEVNLPEAQPVAEATAPAPQPEAPAEPPKRRRRRTKAEIEADNAAKAEAKAAADAQASTETPAAKPRRRRTPAAAAEPQAPSDSSPGTPPTES